MANLAAKARTLTFSMSNSLIEILRSKGVDDLDIEKAQSYRSKYGGQLEKLLVNLGALSEDELPAVYAQFLSTRLVEDADILLQPQPEDFPEINQRFLANRNWFAVRTVEEGACFVTNDPLNWEARQYLASQQSEVLVLVCSDAVTDALRQRESTHQSALQEEDFSALSDVEEDKLRELASEAPTVNLLNSLIARGLKLGASDMHVEPVNGRCRVRYRIDGVLHDSETIPKRLQLPVASRLKILSGMDIAEKRRPQDGKIETKIANTELDIRVSALPLNEGESIVLRFLKKDSVTYDLEVVGMSADIQKWIAEDLQTTAGVILLTGPTGSGKTTTLYTFLNELNDDEVKIITLEDPVEYQLDGINQVQVNGEIGFDFSAGLRSIVRQDPDIIMLGEIRDKETASIAMQSALTGHLVFSTVHTNDAPSAFTRLLDLGVEEFLLNAAIVSIVAQRLARKLCPHCAAEEDEPEALINKYNLSNLGVKNINLRKPVGCEFCSQTGYKGRTAIIEYMRCDDAIKSMDKGQTFLQEAKSHNKSLGRRTLLEDGLFKACQGVTTIEEVIRVAG